MGTRKVFRQITFRISLSEDMRLGMAVGYKIGLARGRVQKIIHDAVMAWVENIEKEMQQKGMQTIVDDAANQDIPEEVQRELDKLEK